MIFDSHAHYDDEKFDTDRDEILTTYLPSKEVIGIINMSSSLESISKTALLTEKYNYVYGGAGIHPECALDLPQNWLDVVSDMLKHPKFVALGEIGLDYFYEDSCPREIQKSVFTKQLELAHDLDLPVSIHDRDAHGDTLDIIRKYRPKGVIHCFSGSQEMASDMIRYGMYLGFGGTVTFKNARHAVEVARMIPSDRILLETDCPYLAPVPLRGTRNDSSNIWYVAEKIAEIRNDTAENILAISRENVRTLFGI